MAPKTPADLTEIPPDNEATSESPRVVLERFLGEDDLAGATKYIDETLHGEVDKKMLEDVLDEEVYISEGLANIVERSLHDLQKRGSGIAEDHRNEKDREYYNGLVRKVSRMKRAAVALKVWGRKYGIELR